MKLGYIRIVITTNFDRLFEQACYDCVIPPTVASSEVVEMLPLAHQRLLILKIHGGYHA